MGALKMAARDIWRRKVRTFLVIIAFGLSIAILIAIPAAAQAYSSSVETTVENLGSAYQGFISNIATEITVGPPQENFGGMPSGVLSIIGGRFMDENIAENIASIPGVVAVAPEIRSVSSLSSAENQGYRGFRNFMIITGIPLNSSVDENYGIQPSNIVSGRALNENDNGCILLGSDLAENYFNVTVSQSVNIGDYSFLVVGIFDAGNRMANRQAYVSLDDAQAMFDQPGEVSQILVFADSVGDVDNIVNAIDSAYGDSVSVTTQSNLLQTIPGFFQGVQENVSSRIARMASLANEEILIAIVVGGLIVCFTMIYAVRERTKEIGILKALGFTNRNVTSQFMVEGAMIGLVGGLVGCLIGSFGAPLLSSILLPSSSITGFSGRFLGPSSQLTAQVVMPSATLILFGLGVAVLLGVVSSLYPSWWASRKRPAEALKYE
jgi:putative ABC transport system permease protein